MDNTNRKCIFGNDLLLRTQSNVGFLAAVAVRFFAHKLNVPYNGPFIHNVYLPCTSHKVLLNHYAAFCLERFWAKGTSSHKCHLPFTDSIVLLKQKRIKVMIAKPAKILFNSFNNNTPLVNLTQGNTQWKSKIEYPSEKRAYFTQTGE